MSLDLAVDKIRLYRQRSDVMVEDLFGVTPDEWQREVLIDFATNPAQAMACCKGPGKTTVMAWLAWNYLLTRAHCKIGAMSITGKNLHDNLWTEMAVWQKKSKLLLANFDWGHSRITQRDHPETWFMTEKTWPQGGTEAEMGNTLAGLWANYVMILMDEAGGIPVPVLRAAEAILGQCGVQGREAHLIIAGNTTSSDGTLYEAVINRRHMFKVYEVTADPDDPKRTPRISVEYARKQIDTYGRTDPFVMINILAKFPLQGINKLISIDQVKECIGRHLHQHAYDFAAKIIGVDLAEFGDDRTVFFPRQGPAYGSPIIIRSMDTLTVAGHLAEFAAKLGAHSIQIDSAGGYGSAPIKRLNDLGFSAVGVAGSAKPRDPRFFNLRSECIWNAAEHLKAGASLPSDCPELVAELVEPTYGFKSDKILIEPKEFIKARLGRSPDLADALAYTHAYPVADPVTLRTLSTGFDAHQNFGKSRTDYDPLTRD